MIKQFASLLMLGAVAAPGFAIINGVDAPEFTFVGQVGVGSGVVVAPNWVLTVRHVNETAFLLNGVTYVPNLVVDADGTNGSPVSDLRLLRFANSFSSFSSPYYVSALGQTATLVGFGQGGTLRADGTGFDLAGGSGVRRKGTNVLSATADVQLPFLNNITVSTYLYDLDGAGIDTFGDGGPLTVNGVNAEAGYAEGDSGGGTFLNVSGAWRVVAINDFVFDQNNNGNSFDFGDGGGAVRLNAYQTWIEANINPVPEPASMLALAAGALALLSRRRANR
jgi:hypothetical protein